MERLFQDELVNHPEKEETLSSSVQEHVTGLPRMPANRRWGVRDCSKEKGFVGALVCIVLAEYGEVAREI